MNERYEQLMAQAWIEFAPDAKAVTKRFAELIVGECYLWAKENGGLGCEEDFEALKEHFGVEE
jgi:hypothetical protein